MDDLAVQVAVIGAVAALLGGLIGAGSQIWAESRRRESERQRDLLQWLEDWRSHKRMVYSELLTSMNRYRSTYSNARDRGVANPLGDPGVAEALNGLLVAIGAAALVADDPSLRSELVKAGVKPHGLWWSEELLDKFRRDILLPAEPWARNDAATRD